MPSLVISRLDKLNALSQAIAQASNRTDAFNALELQDRTKILGALKISKFDWTTIEKKGLKGRIKKELQTITATLRSQSTQPRAFLLKVPKAVITTIIGPYLTGRDLAAFQSSFKAASELLNTSHIIKHYKLKTFITAYLHSSYACLGEGGKARVLDKLMTFAYTLSKIEKLPRPSYPSLGKFFELVEARNFIRMVGGINIANPLPDLSKTVSSLAIPKAPLETIERAELIRTRFVQHQEFLGSINENLNLAKCNLSLLPKEIGKLQTVSRLWLHDNQLTTLNKKFGKLQKLTICCLNRNRLTSLPKEFEKLTRLEVLMLNNNLLSTLPKKFGQLKALDVLVVEKNSLFELPKGLEKFNKQLKNQNKKLQLKNLLDCLMLSLNDKRDYKAIAAILVKIEKFLGKRIRLKLDHAIYEVCKKASKTDRVLATKLKNPKFKQKAFADPGIALKLKGIAIAQFWKANKK